MVLVGRHVESPLCHLSAKTAKSRLVTAHKVNLTCREMSQSYKYFSANVQLSVEFLKVSQLSLHMSCGTTSKHGVVTKPFELAS